mmetsp:Transcript_56190/g.142411  ORF Transcript_56190/g.142411 Transcript_56190/m.142411 type:complete len:83 (-) Transcript_56190:8-256(-)
MSMSNNLSVFQRGWWMVAKVVHCSVLAWCITISKMRWEVDASRPLEGSSSRSTRGLVTISMPIDTRFRCPPDRPLFTVRCCT